MEKTRFPTYSRKPSATGFSRAEPEKRQTPIGEVVTPSDQVTSTHGTTTGLIGNCNRGGKEAIDALFEKIYQQLRHVARRQIADEPPENTLFPTELVNELWIGLESRNTFHWKNRHHFFASVAKMMRLILVDHARKRHTEKRGRDYVKISFEDLYDVPVTIEVAVVALNDALKGLEKIDLRQARYIEMRFFGGMTHDEIAKVEEVSTTTVRREIRRSIIWIRHELSLNEREAD